MKKVLLAFSFFLATIYGVTAQSEAFLTHYFMNPVLINPGATGFMDKYQIFLHYRGSWAGFDNAPKTYSLSFNAPVGDKIGLGGLLMQDNIATLKQFRGQLSYSFRYKIGAVKMAIGLSTEIRSLQLSSLDGNPLFNPNDLIYNDYLRGRRSFDAGLGIMGSYDGLYFGISAPNLISAKLDATTSSEENNLLSSGLLHVGYRYISNEFLLEPSILIGKARNTPFIADFGIRSAFANEAVMVGLTYHAGLWKAASLLIGTKYNGFMLAYTYDYSFQKFQNYNNGSHEVTVGFEFARKVSKKGAKMKKYRS